MYILYLREPQGIIVISRETLNIAGCTNAYIKDISNNYIIGV